MSDLTTVSVELASSVSLLTTPPVLFADEGALRGREWGLGADLAVGLGIACLSVVVNLLVSGGAL